MKYKTSTLLNLLFLLFISFGFTENGISQTDRNGKIVAFHPSVGNSLTLSEKKEFFLFSEYNDSLFESAQLVKHNIDTYTVLIKTTKGQSFEKSISIQELDAIYASIEKIKPQTKATDDYVVKPQSKEKEIKTDKFEAGYIAAQITLQVIFVLLEILAHAY